LHLQGIKALKKKASHKATSKNLKLVQEALQTQYNHVPTIQIIWKSLRDKNIAKQIRAFLWKSMHGEHHIGKF
ncbi:hypothetical protein B0H14DRAFT_2354959, partial [Mycena olivaceomarginata]